MNKILDEPMYLQYFTQDKSFPFFIHKGSHEQNLLQHYHADFCELVIVLNGTAIHIVDNDEYLIKKGDVFVIQHNTRHGFKNVHDFQIYNVMFRMNEMIFWSSDIRKSSGFQALFVVEPMLAKNHSFQSRLRLQLADFEEVQELIERIIEEYNSQREGRETIISSLFLFLIVMLSRFYSENYISEKSSVIDIAKPISFIESHFHENISVNELALMANVSERHFSRLFQEIYDITPMQYISSLRLEHACKLLKTTKLTISEIAQQSGYPDSNYFSRKFRKKFLQSPKLYREKNRTK